MINKYQKVDKNNVKVNIKIKNIILVKAVE